MPPDQATEFSRRRSLPYVEVTYSHTPRTQEVTLSLCGREIGSMTRLFKRGKEVSTHYFLPALEVTP